MDFRPHYHFTPEKNWLNDPNGCVKLDGIYHLFFQYHPDSNKWGPMHWGHAVSTDGISWTEKDIALFPDKLGMPFSGSAVVDRHNVTGFFEDDRGIVLFYTAHRDEPDVLQRQCLAYSCDGGETFQKYKGNPIVTDRSYKDFRDPKVFYHEESEQWVMVLAAGDRAVFYLSENLLEWGEAGVFALPIPGRKTLWECPDLFPLTDRRTGERHWFLVMSHGNDDGGPVQYYMAGQFDGCCFMPYEKKWLSVDDGLDFYAAQSWYDDEADPFGKEWIAWAVHWKYSQETPEKEYRGVMTLPRRVETMRVGGKQVLRQAPVDTMMALTGEKLIDGPLNKEIILPKENRFRGEIVLSSLNDSSQDLEIIWSGGEKFALRASEETIAINRRGKSGLFTDKKWSFFRIDRKKISPDMKLEVLVDASIIELFIDDGIQTLTYRMFPSGDLSRLEISHPEHAMGKISRI